MGNLLRNIKIVPEYPKLENPKLYNPFINELHQNIDELSKEFHNLKKNVNLSIRFENDPEELQHKIFKIRDLKNSLNFKKKQLKDIMHIDTAVTQEASLALDVLKSYANELEARLLEKYSALRL